MAPKFIARKRRSFDSHRAKAVPLQAPTSSPEVCLQLDDNSLLQKSAIDFFKTRGANNPAAAAARLSEQFEHQNRSLLSLMNVRMVQLFDGNDVFLHLESGNVVGAVPLRSPTTATPDYGLIVRPRFPWKGIGGMLAEMGWRIAPTPLKLPLLRRSERQTPPWVISSMVLVRLKQLLDSMNRRFETVRENRNSPRGAVDWTAYAEKEISRGHFLSVPCTFPDLRDDALLKGAIRFSLEKYLRSLETQVEHGAFVHRLIQFCEEFLQKVRTAAVYIPSTTTLAQWLQRPIRAEHLAAGLQAIQWTLEDRGLAGISDLEGIPWHMPMEQFFESWVETVFSRVARQTGGTLKTGRRRETTRAIRWDPAYIGSQKSLTPDIWIELDSTTVIVDAKYKRHWEELQHHSWHSADQIMKEAHRNDLFQVLAYANLARTPRVIACLAYPCSPETWASMLERGRLIHKADVTTGSRNVAVWLTAVPMATEAEKIAIHLTDALRHASA